jgi:serine/threonine-protein kinase
MTQPALTPDDDGIAISIHQGLLSRTLGGRYRLEAILSAGRGSAVFEATDTQMHRKVAVKILRPQSEVSRSRFEREAEALSRLQHPNTLTIFDFGTADDGMLYMVSELLCGASLKDVLAAEGPMSPRRALRIAMQIAGSLAGAHKVGIVHRDIKPSNIFLVEYDGSPDFVKVLDFGVAKLMHPELDPVLSEQDITAMGVIVGTPIYMPPEQFASGPVDGRVDIYSVGVVFFEMLTGEPPFKEPDLIRQCRAHLMDPVPPLDAKNDSGARVVHPAIEAAVLKMLGKEPADRFQTAEAMRLALLDAACVAGFFPRGFTMQGLAAPLDGGIPADLDVERDPDDELDVAEVVEDTLLSDAPPPGMEGERMPQVDTPLSEAVGARAGLAERPVEPPAPARRPIEPPAPVGRPQREPLPPPKDDSLTTDPYVRVEPRPLASGHAWPARHEAPTLSRRHASRTLAAALALFVVGALVSLVVLDRVGTLVVGSSDPEVLPVQREAPIVRSDIPTTAERRMPIETQIAWTTSSP